MTREQVNRSFLQFALTHLHPSFLMAILMALIFIAIETNETSVFMQWTVDKTGVTVGVWEGAMIVFGFAIVYFKPHPLVTIGLSFPAVILGIYMIWFGLGTNGMDAIVILYLMWGYVATAMMMILASNMMQIAAENVALRKAQTATVVTGTSS